MLKGFINRTLPITRIKLGIANIIYSVLHIFYGNKPRLITRKGVRFEIDLSEAIDLSLFLFGNYQSHVNKSKLLQLPKDAVMIDIGANIGAMCLQFAKAAPSGKIYAFEPAHATLVRLKRNLELNPELAANIEVIHSFVSAKSVEKDADIKAYSSWKVDGKTTGEKHPRHGGLQLSTEGVGSISIDDFCKSAKLARLDFIKIDTDGHENEIFMGAKETIVKFRPQIIFEIGIYVMEENNVDFSFYSNYFKEFNYCMYDSDNGHIITMDNYKNYIPKNGTIDIIANPLPLNGK